MVKLSQDDHCRQHTRRNGRRELVGGELAAERTAHVGITQVGMKDTEVCISLLCNLDCLPMSRSRTDA